ITYCRRNRCLTERCGLSDSCMLFDDPYCSGANQLFHAFNEGFIRGDAEPFWLKNYQVIIALLKVQQNFSLAWSRDYHGMQFSQRRLAHTIQGDANAHA